MKQNFNLLGVWISKYSYPSSSSNQQLLSQSEVKIYKAGNHITIQSLPNKDNSYILMKLAKDGRILTGTWHEQTSQKGRHKGVVYFGAIQLIIREDGNVLSGKWVGFGKNMKVNTGSWILVRKHPIKIKHSKQ